MAHTALITGASRGLGRALAHQLAAKGWRVVLVARHGDALQTVVDEIRAAGGSAWAFAADLSHPDAAARIHGFAEAVAGPVDLLVNNASALGPTPLRPLLDSRGDELDAVLQTNVVGPFRLTAAFAGAMALRGQGTIVFISSDAAVEAYPTWGAYGLSKAAADHMARTLAAELPMLRVLSVDPGEMDTVMHADAVPDADRNALRAPEDSAARILNLLDAATSGQRLQA